jgi:hypothetical protein
VNAHGGTLSSEAVSRRVDGVLVDGDLQRARLLVFRVGFGDLVGHALQQRLLGGQRAIVKVEFEPQLALL